MVCRPATAVPCSSPAQSSTFSALLRWLPSQNAAFIRMASQNGASDSARGFAKLVCRPATAARLRKMVSVTPHRRGFAKLVCRPATAARLRKMVSVTPHRRGFAKGCERVATAARLRWRICRRPTADLTPGKTSRTSRTSRTGVVLSTLTRRSRSANQRRFW